ncbi:MAG: hypothetical protein GXY19_04130 [Phycisphaerae bacterium]|nr:hypothetical protein [Phycisphaerae bacterium]
MGKIIKVRCNGPEGHVNEVDLDEVLREDVVLKQAPAREGRRIPERLVLPCRFCTVGKVIVTREMIEENP